MALNLALLGEAYWLYGLGPLSRAGFPLFVLHGPAVKFGSAYDYFNAPTVVKISYSKGMIATPCNALLGLTACIARLIERGASVCAQLKLLLCLSACGVEREAPRGMREDIAQTGVFAISRTLFIQTESVQLILSFYLILSAATGYREHSEFALLMESLTWVTMFVMLGNSPLSVYEQEHRDQGLDLMVGRLPERERQVIVGHYYQYLSFVELSQLLGVSKSRISQLHSQALKRVRGFYEELGDGGGYF